MYRASNENQLMVENIVDVMVDYTSIQPDIDESKVKAACLVAQNIDIKRVIKKDNLERCINPEAEADEDLLSLVIPALCHFTYFRMLKMFPGTLTDSGFIIDKEATDKDVAKEVASHWRATAESFMEDVIDFLDGENDDDVDSTKKTPQIRVFGGEENRDSW